MSNCEKMSRSRARLSSADGARVRPGRAGEGRPEPAGRVGVAMHVRACVGEGERGAGSRGGVRDTL